MKIANYKKYSSKKFSQLYKYFISYIALLVVVLSVLGGIVYKNFIFTLQKEVEMSNISIINQIQETIDTRMKEMERTALSIHSNPNLKPYKILTGPYDAGEGVKQLGQYKSSNEFVYDIALYYNTLDNNRIHTTTMNTNLIMFFDYIYQYKEWSKNDFQSSIYTLTYPVMRPVETIMLNRNQEKRFSTYLYPLPPNAVKPYGIVLFLIDENAFKNILKSALKDYDGYIYILDNQNNLIVDLIYNRGILVEGSEGVSNQLLTTSFEDTINHIEIENKNYSVTRLISPYNNWSYIMAIETEQFMQKANTSKKAFYTAILIVLLVGIIIALIFAIGNYRPLKKLMKMFPESSRIYGYIDEFDYITRGINYVAQEKQDLVKQLNSERSIFKNQILLKILEGKIYEEKEIQTIKNVYGIELGHPYFTVIVFLIDDYDNLRDIHSKKGQDLIFFSMINVAEELAKGVGVGYGVELPHKGRVAIILNTEKEHTKERYLSELAFKTKDFFKEHFGFSLTAGIGNYYTDINMLSESFLEANRAVYYRLIRGYDNVIFYEDIKATYQKEYKYPIALESELIMAIKQGKNEKIEELTKKIKEHIISNHMSLESVQCICYGIINAIMKTLNEMNIDIDSKLTEDKESLFVQPFETIDELGNRILQFSEKICAHIIEQKESKNFQLRDRLLDIVHARYKDPNLSLDLISKEVQISPSYASRYFKDHTGYSLMQYVDFLRMEEVKRFLQETELPLKEIISEVGYIDQSSFIRKFRNKEGMTPIQYRNILK